MNTHVDESYPLHRVAVRAVVGLWRNRGRVLLALLMSVALFGYVITHPQDAPSALAQVAPIDATADCANTVMSAIANPSPAAAQLAYQCMAPAFQQTMSEPVFVQQLQALRVPNVTSINRLGTYQAPTGGTLVYFAVDTSAGSVGYVMNLGPDVKVVQIT
jgi:hypothetical protein